MANTWSFSLTTGAYFLYVLWVILPMWFVIAWATLLRRPMRATLRSLPPGPAWRWPIIGDLPRLRGGRLHRNLYELSKLHGPLMMLRAGSVNLLVASNAAMASQILQKCDSIFAGRPHIAARVHLGYSGAGIVFAQPDVNWKNLRALCASQLFRPSRLCASRPMRARHVHAAMRSILECARLAEPVNLRPVLSTAAIDILCSLAMGDALSTSSAEFPHMMEELMLLVGTTHLGDVLPWLPNAVVDHVQGFVPRMKRVHRYFDAVLQHVIDSRRRAAADALDDDENQTVLDLVLAEKNPVSDTTIKALLLDLFVGGTESWSHTVEWAIAELMRNPNVMQKLEHEVMDVVGTNRIVHEDDLPNMSYLHAVLKETFRLHPTAPLLAPHESRTSCHIEQWYVPAGTMTLVNAWAIGRDSEAWERPLQFWPDRFLNNDIDIKGHHFSLLPFGSGRRMCPGWTLGLENAQLTLASFVHAFHFTLPTSGGICKDIDMTENVGITTKMEKPLILLPGCNLEAHVYNLL